MNVAKKIITITLLAIILFFAISFVTVIFQINSPIHRQDLQNKFEIGFPLKYYYEFWVEKPIPNSGWNLRNLAIDFILVWIISFFGFRLLKK